MDTETSGRRVDVLLRQLRGSTADRNMALTSLVKSELRQSIQRFLRSKGANETEATSIINDVLIAFAKRVIKDRDFAPTELDPYLMSMAKYQLYDLLKSRTKSLSIEYLQEELGVEVGIDPMAEKLILRSEKGRLIKDILSQMRSRCKEVLLSWSGGYSMKEIAESIGYKSDMMARKKKSQCMKELMDYLAERPHLKTRLRQG